MIGKQWPWLNLLRVTTGDRNSCWCYDPLLPRLALEDAAITDAPDPGITQMAESTSILPELDPTP